MIAFATNALDGSNSSLCPIFNVEAISLGESSRTHTRQSLATSLLFGAVDGEQPFYFMSLCYRFTQRFGYQLGMIVCTRCQVQNPLDIREGTRGRHDQRFLDKFVPNPGTEVRHGGALRSKTGTNGLFCSRVHTPS